MLVKRGLIFVPISDKWMIAWQSPLVQKPARHVKRKFSVIEQKEKKDSEFSVSTHPQSCSFSSTHPWRCPSFHSHLILLNPLFLSLKQELFGDTFAPPRSPPSSLRVAGARVHVLEPQRDLRRLDRARSFPPTPTNRRA